MLGENEHRTDVSIVVPVRNEEPYIRACLLSLVGQDYTNGDIEIIVVDGLSSDATRTIVEDIRQQYPQVRLLQNPAGIVPTGMNIGIRSSCSDIIIRADGHNVYPADYASNCVKYLERTGADNVGGPLVTVPANDSFSARLVAAILTNPIGVGNARFRTSSYEGFVDTVPFGAFRRELFDRIGLYNEKLVRNQDIELNARIRQAGGKIFLTPALTTQYHPVATFGALLQYAYKSSLWNVYTLRENGGSLSVRHIAPALFIAWLFLLTVLSVFQPYTTIVLLIATLGLYLAIGYYFAFRSTNDRKIAVSLPFATFCFHASYGLAMLVGLFFLFKEPSFRPIRAGLPVQKTED